MDDIRRFTTYAEVKVFTHPLRIEIVRRLEVKPMTMAQVGRDLKINPAKLYYHVNELERISVVRVAKTRKVGNLTERYFELTAKEYRFDYDAILSLGEEGHAAFSQGVTAVLEATQQAFRDAQFAGRIGSTELQALRARLFSIRMDREATVKFQLKLQELIDQIDAEPKTSPITAHWGLVYFPLSEENAT